MLGLGSAEFTVEGLGLARVPDKLVRGGVGVLSVRAGEKNTLLVRVRGKDRKKVFAILRGSCYNIKKVRDLGAEHLRRGLLASAGLVAGAAFFLAAVLFFGGRVLDVEVVGNGAYYEREVRDVLARAGVTRFAPLPAHTASIRAEILSLPRVEFCSVRAEGGVVTVEVRVSDEAPAASRSPLYAPAAGVVEELVVLRGTPLVSVGDEVAEGAEVVAAYALYGSERRPVAVMARVTVRFAFSREYAAGEAEAVAQARLDFGELAEYSVKKTERGWLAEGTARRSAAVNFG